MTALATPSRPLHMGKAKTGIRIQKPEITSWQSDVKPQTVGLVWKVLVGLTYLFSLIGLYLAFTA